MSSPFTDILTRDRLLALAGDQYFQRGEAYFRQGQVRSLAEYDGVVTAQVAGTEAYRVQLWVEAGELDYDCTCPQPVPKRSTPKPLSKHCEMPFVLGALSIITRHIAILDFEEWVAHLQHTYKAKRNFIQLLIQAEWVMR